MLARIRKAIKDQDQGFTLIELLVVMIIIGILAAIAVPVFLSQRAKAQDSAAKSDVSAIGKELASYYVDGTAAPTVSISGSGSARRYTITPAGGTAIDVGKASNNVVLYGPTDTAAAATGLVLGTNSGQWCVGVRNPNGDVKNWKYSAQNGLEQGFCASATNP